MNRQHRRSEKHKKKECQHRFRYKESQVTPCLSHFFCTLCGHIATEAEIRNLAEKLKKIGLLKENEWDADELYFWVEHPIASDSQLVEEIAELNNLTKELCARAKDNDFGKKFWERDKTRNLLASKWPRMLEIINQLAALQVASPQDKWLPIRKAPKDESILGAMSDGSIKILWWNTNKGTFGSNDTGKAGWIDGTFDHTYDESNFTFEPTHYIPLPNPPQDGGSGNA